MVFPEDFMESSFRKHLWNMKNFKLLDWRQDFDRNLIVGDIYYDLAKLLHDDNIT